MRPGVVPATTSRPDTVTDSVRHTTQAHKRARAGLAHAELTHRRERPHTEHEPPRAMLPRVRRIPPSCTHAANRTAASRTNHRRPAAHPGSDGAHASAASHASRAAESRYDCVKEPRSGESLQCNQHREPCCREPRREPCRREPHRGEPLCVCRGWCCCRWTLHERLQLGLQNLCHR
jgi:hypothetical protein